MERRRQKSYHSKVHLEDNATKEAENDKKYREMISNDDDSSHVRAIDAEDKCSDVIISSLGSSTINWIKKHRAKSSTTKVAMTFHNEKQLRRIFDGFDFDSSGMVSLVFFHKAVEYCKADKTFSRMTDKLNHLIDTFYAMDTDGDGTVDFHEFCVGKFFLSE